MAKPRFTAAQSHQAIRENTIRKVLCQAEQDGHRAMIVSLKNLEKRLGLRQTKAHSVPLMITANIDRTYREIQEEIEWRKDQIQILEMDRVAAHNAIKYHSKRVEGFQEVPA